MLEGCKYTWFWRHMHHKSNRTDKPWSVGNVNIEIFEKKKKKKKNLQLTKKKIAIYGDRLPA